MMGHRPEVYLSWLYALSGEELFGCEDAMSIDLRVRPIKQRFNGVVLADYAKDDYGRIAAYLLDNSMHLRLDDGGNPITVERFEWSGYYSPWNWYLRMILLNDRYLYSEYRVMDGADFLYYEIQYRLYDLSGNVPLLFSAKTDQNGMLVLTDNKFETYTAPVEIGKVGSTLNVGLMTETLNGIFGRYGLDFKLQTTASPFYYENHVKKIQYADIPIGVIKNLTNAKMILDIDTTD